MRYDPERVRELIMQLSELCDPRAFMSWIAKKTAYGRKPGPDPWTYTRQLFEGYGRPEDAGKLIAAFDAISVKDEVDAGVWLAEHGDQIP